MKIIHLKRTKMEVTPFGGLLLVHDFIRNIDLEVFVKDRFSPPGSNRGRSPWQFISSTSQSVYSLYSNSDCTKP